MKKIVIFLSVICSLLLTGCSENITLDLEKVSTELNELKSEKFDMHSVYFYIDQTNYFENLEDIYDYDFKETFGLNSENIGAYNVRINKETLDMYLILEPLTNKDVIKSEMNNYFKSINKEDAVLETEYEGYLIYILSSDNEKVLETMKKAKEVVFSNLMKVEDEAIEETLNIKSEQYSEILMEIPAIMVKSNMYIVVKPEKNETENVKKAIDDYMKKLEEQWATYLPDQFKLVEDRLVEEYKGYLIYIISSDNQKALETIKNCVSE